MRGAAPSVVCPRCGHESPPSGAGRFMSCAKCGMSIDSQAEPPQERVRRPTETPEVEVEVDPTLPPTPSKFPFIPALVALLVVTGIAIYGGSRMMANRRDAAKERENLHTVELMQQAFSEAIARLAEHPPTGACKVLLEIVQRPCLSTVEPEKLDFDEAVLALTTDNASACVDAVEHVSRSRVDAHCD